MSWLLDGNVLVALVIDSHIHHDRVHRWFARLKRDRFATCVLTQGTLLRVHMKTAVDGSATAAWQSLSQVAAHPKHEWWSDSLNFLNVPHISHYVEPWYITRRSTLAKIIAKELPQ